MASSGKVCLFLDSLLLEPIIIDCPLRFAMINPKDYGGSSNSEVFAIISSDEGDIQTRVNDGVTVGDQYHFILDSTFTRKFLFLRNTGSSSNGGQSTKSNAKRDDIIDLSDSPTKDNGTPEVCLSSDNEGTSDNKATHSIDGGESDNSQDIKSSFQTGAVHEGSRPNIPIHSANKVEQESTLQCILISSYKYKTLSKIISACKVVLQVEEIPQHYNGNCVFEFPPVSAGCSSMVGMEQKYDGHCWVKPVQTRMSFPAVIRRSRCGGHLMCNNHTCPKRALRGEPNETSWTGKLLHVIPSIGMSCSPYGSLVCFHCGEAPVLLKDCPCIVYYVLTEDNRSRLFIHQGTHTHPVAKEILRSSIQKHVN